MFKAAVLECHEHFIVHFGEEVGAATIAGHRRDDTRPVALVIKIEPWEAYLHAVHAVGIPVVRDDPDDNAVEPAVGVAWGEKRPQQLVVDHVAFLRAEKRVLYPFFGRKKCSTESR